MDEEPHSYQRSRKKTRQKCGTTHPFQPLTGNLVGHTAGGAELFENPVTVRNQTVLLNGVNNDASTMKTLIRNLADINIQPVCDFSQVLFDFY